MTEPRIVSLLGSATEIVFALGLERFLVGISHECDYPVEALTLPRVSRARFDPTGLDSGEIDDAVRRCMEEFGSVYEIDVALLRTLHPTLVLTQAICEVCAVPTGSVEDAVRSLDGEVNIVSLDAHTIEEILHTITLVADAADESHRGSALVESVRNRLVRVSSRLEGLTAPRVMLLEWLDPPFVPGHWVPEMVACAGGQNLLGSPGSRSVSVEWADLRGTDPDILLIEPCGFDLDAAAIDAERNRGRVEEVARRALADGKAWVLHSAWFSRSGPRVVEGIETLAHLFHPGAFPEVAIEGRARRWG